ncbi:MAG: serine/threonine-protein kinase, partial [Acidobacteriota bacterium]
MNPSRFKQIDELFDAALDLLESEREAFLSEKCGDDKELKKEVLFLLNTQNQDDNFLEQSAMGVVAKQIAEVENFAISEEIIGKKFGTYTIESLLGTGGMGQVYLANDQKLHRKVALKILPTEYTSDDERVKRFQMEARAISTLNHPNIMTIYDVGSDENVSYIATEYVEGKTFRELIADKPTVKEAINVVIQTCEALSSAHNAGI